MLSRVYLVQKEKSFSIEEMFRDFKSGGYNLESTNVSGNRLIVLILLLTIAYSSATFFGEKVKLIGVQKYVGRVKESGRKERRHSSFYIGLHGQNWVNIMKECDDLVQQLMTLNCNKRSLLSTRSESYKAYSVGIIAIVVAPSDNSGNIIIR